MIEQSNGDLEIDNLVGIPGLTGGLELSPSLIWRTLVGVDFQFRRMNNARFFGGGTNSLNLITYPEFFAAVDYFFSQRWGVRLEGRIRRAVMPTLNTVSDDLMLTEFEAIDRGFLLSTIVHLN